VQDGRVIGTESLRVWLSHWDIVVVLLMLEMLLLWFYFCYDDGLLRLFLIMICDCFRHCCMRLSCMRLMMLTSVRFQILY
jgi:hypothetical protein